MRFKPKFENEFGLAPWNLIDNSFSAERAKLLYTEAVFSQGNGFIGMRGSLDENISDDEWESYNACFLNGSYEYENILYTWRRHGLTEKSQVMLRIPDWNFIVLTVDDELFRMKDVNVLSTKRIFDIKTGIITRKVEWETKQGKKVTINSKRFISLTRKNSCVIDYNVSVNKTAKIAISTEFNGNIKNLFSKNKFLSVVNLNADKNKQNIELVTERSKQRVVMASILTVDNSDKNIQGLVKNNKTISNYSTKLEPSKSLNIQKFINIILTKKDDKDSINTAISKVAKDAKDGVSVLENEQNKYWKKFWDNADIIIDGDTGIQQGIRYCMMQLIQNSGKDGKTNIGAKGMTGYNYAGKCFWDTEIFMQPFFLNANPEFAKALIDFRYNTLDKAKEHALNLSFKDGALFPWETINGEESSFTYEAGTAQYHLQCAIGYSIKKYFDITNDLEFLADKALEVLIETSRILFNVGAFIPARDNQFCMNCVCGPDEYSPMVDNNCYTNTMTMHHFDFTLQIIAKVAEKYPAKFAKLKSTISLKDAEFANWKKAKENMYIPYSKKYGIQLQDDQFLYRDPVNLEEWMKTDEYKKHKIHPLNLFRKQLLKQADVILLMVLRAKDYSIEQKRANYEFYEPKTINDSSLSPCSYSIVANEIGLNEQFLPYLNYTVRLDLDHYQGTGGGIHTASMGGAWLSIIQGIAGIVVQDGKIYINPKFPKEWGQLEFKYRFNNSQVNIKINSNKIEMNLLDGNGFDFEFNNKKYSISKTNKIFVYQEE